MIYIVLLLGFNCFCVCEFFSQFVEHMVRKTDAEISDITAELQQQLQEQPSPQQQQQQQQQQQVYIFQNSSSFV